MRLKTSRIKDITLYNKTIEKDNEGVTSIKYPVSSSIKAEVWPASSQLQVQTYGDRIHSIQNVKVKGKYTIQDENSHVVYNFGDFTISEGDGIGLYTQDAPDYKIISITPYKPLKMEIERL